MAENKVYRKKLDENGEPLIVDGDFIMELVSSVEVPDPAIAPNWHGLEQTLRYANDEALFLKAFQLAQSSTAVAVGFNLMMQTLANGVAGRSSQNALAVAFQVLGVPWTDAEKDQINQILTDHNFTFQI